MARRPKKTQTEAEGPETDTTNGFNGPDPETVANFYRRMLTAFDEIEEAKAPLKAASSRLRAIEKAASNHGINVGSLRRAVKGVRGDPAQFERDIQADVMVARILKRPVGQLDLLPALDIGPQVELHVRMTDIEHDGYAKGRVGVPRAENKYTPGTEEFVQWEAGWMRGNRKHLPGSAPTVRKGATGSGPELTLVSDNSGADPELQSEMQLDNKVETRAPTKGSQSVPAVKPGSDGTTDRFVKRKNGMWTDHEGLAHDGDVVSQGRLMECHDGGYQAYSADHKTPFETMPEGLQPAEKRWWQKGYIAAQTAMTKTGETPDTGDLNQRLLAASDRYPFDAHKACKAVADHPEYSRFFCNLLVSQLPSDVGPHKAMVATFEWGTSVLEGGGQFTRECMEMLFSDKFAAYIDAAMKLRDDLKGFLSNISDDIPKADIDAANSWIDQAGAFIEQERKALMERAENTALVGNEGGMSDAEAQAIIDHDNDLPEELLPRERNLFGEDDDGDPADVAEDGPELEITPEPGNDF